MDRRGPRRPPSAARLFLLLLSVDTLARFSAVASAQPADLPPPQSQPADVTAGDRLLRLSSIQPRDLSRNDLALRSALEFSIAIGAADGPRAAAIVDAIGYQALPIEGRLPELPQKPLPANAVSERVGQRKAFDVAGLPANTFEVLSAAETARVFPAVGQWMLPPQDVVIRVAAPATPAGRWVSRPACLVVRIRGTRATIVGGNLVEVLALH